MIGAGAAGLAAARTLRDSGHQVRIFEQGQRPGGIWAYEPEVEDDLLGLNPTNPVYSSLYDNLRTNLPSDLMAFRDYPFDERGGGDASWRRYPHHSHVLTYLENFAKDFDLGSMVTYSAQVQSIMPHGVGWRLVVRESSKESEFQFDAVAVCNGHFSKPRVPELAGARSFTGIRLHSHNYRRPEIFTGKTVAVLGTGASGADIVQELVGHARKVLWCGFPGKDIETGEVRRLPLPHAVADDRLIFDTAEIKADVLLYCTGYLYDFPFLTSDIVKVNDNHVAPLYRDILPPYWPRLGLIGLPFLVVPFPLYAMQARWFAATLDGSVKLPDSAQMLRTAEADAKTLLADGVRRRHLHRLGHRQENYYNLLARECGEPELPPEFGDLAKAAQEARQRNPAGFRDEALAVTLPNQT